MIVNNTQRGIIYIPVMSGTAQRGSIALVPGNNEVSDDFWNEVKKSEAIRRKLGSKQLKEVAVKGVEKEVTKEVEEKTEDGKTKKTKKKVKEKVNEPVPFSEVDASEAEKIVTETYDLKTLKKWKDTESRDSVRLAISKQIEKVDKYGVKEQEAAEGK
jgi:hypothetical protein